VANRARVGKVAMLRGAKRYILTPPSQCKHLSILKERAHPSYRHSTADWSDPHEAFEDGFGNVQVGCMLGMVPMSAWLIDDLDVRRSTPSSTKGR
jgi:site-specific recombinase